MMMDILKLIKGIKTKRLTNNTQKVALKLLRGDGKWIARNQLETIPSAAARVRDLRKPQFGGFQVECRSATSLKRHNAKKGMFYYRIVPDTVTPKQVEEVFKI
jgi:hypothetical protein